MKLKPFYQRDNGNFIDFRNDKRRYRRAVYLAIRRIRRHEGEDGQTSFRDLTKHRCARVMRLINGPRKKK